MHRAEFDRLVAYEKKRQKSLVEVYETLDPERQRGPYLCNCIAESSASRSTWDALNRMVQHYLHERRQLPDELAGWAADALDSMVNKPARRPRPPKGTEDAARRKVEIYLSIYHLVKLYGLDPTRGLSGRPECCAEGGSACDIVGAAFGLNYKAVEKIWNERDPLFRSYRTEKK